MDRLIISLHGSFSRLRRVFAFATDRLARTKTSLSRRARDSRRGPNRQWAPTGEAALRFRLISATAGQNSLRQDTPDGECTRYGGWEAKIG